MLLSSLRGGHPMSGCPWRIMPDVLPVAAFKVRNPVEGLVLMKSRDLTRDSGRLCTHRFHKPFYLTLFSARLGIQHPLHSPVPYISPQFPNETFRPSAALRPVRITGNPLPKGGRHNPSSPVFRVWIPLRKDAMIWRPANDSGRNLRDLCKGSRKPRFVAFESLSI
jgi:hypothetical protein